MDVIPDDSAEVQRLIDHVRAGNPEAIDQLFGYYRTYLNKVIEMRLVPQIHPRLDASDVVQETQLEAVRRIKNYLEQEPVPFRLWLRQIAHDQLLKARRRHMKAAKRSMNREMPLPDRSSLQLAKQLIAGGSTPSQHVSKQEQARHIREALMQTSEVDREIILMRNLEELSYHEIGYILGIDADAARKRHGRALLRLGKILNEKGLSESQI